MGLIKQFGCFDRRESYVGKRVDLRACAGLGIRFSGFLNAFIFCLVSVASLGNPQRLCAQFEDLPPLESPSSNASSANELKPPVVVKDKVTKDAVATDRVDNGNTEQQKSPNSAANVLPTRNTTFVPLDKASSFDAPPTTKTTTKKTLAASQKTSNAAIGFDGFDDVFQITHPGANANLDDPYQVRLVREKQQDATALPIRSTSTDSAFQPTGNKFQTLQTAKRSERNLSSFHRQPIVKRTGGTEYRPWWLEKFAVDRQLPTKQRSVAITVDMLVISMLRNSPEIRALSQEPLIASTFVDVENANFDPITFLESKWDDTSEPVGNLLTTNNSPFLKDHIATAKAGFRKKNRIGTDVELSQNVGFKNSNSEFFQPQDQGTARLELSVNQPLLNGAGKVVGTSRILLAELDSDISQHQLAEKLQEKILVVIKAYWELFYQKSVYELRNKNHESAVEILRLLKGRASFDAQRSQVIRAEAAVASRRLELVRSRTDVQNAETRVRELTRDPRFGKLGVLRQQELVPVEFPQVNSSAYPNLPAVVSVAFENRPEISQAMGRLKAASIQNDVAKNQLLPQLSLIVNAYTAALNGDSGIEQAWQRQFVDSTPGYSAGLVFEYPIYNRAAQAKKQRIEAEMTKLSAELDDAFGDITAEVEIAYRELKMAYEATQQSLESIMTAERDQVFIQKRWENFAFLENQDFASPTIFLEQLLDAQDRITQAQIQYANSTRQFMIASAELRKAEGSLLNYRSLTGRELELLQPADESDSQAPTRDLAPERNQ